MQAGAHYLGEGKCRFSVWAPLKKSMVLHIVAPEERKLRMNKEPSGYFVAEIDGIKPGTEYLYIPGNKKSFADPASFYQPNGVHSASAVLDHSSYKWHDEHWRGIPLREMIIYELHIGTF